MCVHSLQGWLVKRHLACTMNLLLLQRYTLYISLYIQSCSLPSILGNCIQRYIHLPIPEYFDDCMELPCQFQNHFLLCVHSSNMPCRLPVLLLNHLSLLCTTNYLVPYYQSSLLCSMRRALSMRTLALVLVLFSLLKCHIPGSLPMFVRTLSQYQRLTSSNLRSEPTLRLSSHSSNGHLLHSTNIGCLECTACNIVLQ